MRKERHRETVIERIRQTGALEYSIVQVSRNYLFLLVRVRDGYWIRNLLELSRVNETARESEHRKNLSKVGGIRTIRWRFFSSSKNNLRL